MTQAQLGGGAKHEFSGCVKMGARRVGPGLCDDVNDLWRVLLSGEGEPERISKDRCDNLLFEGDYIYFIRNGVTRNSLSRIKKDGTGEAEDLGGDNLHFLSLAKSGDRIYYCTNPTIGYKNLSYYSISENKSYAVQEGDTFSVGGSIIYFNDQRRGNFCAYNTADGSVSTLVEGVEITDILVSGNSVYYVNGGTELYRVSLSGGTPAKIYTGNVSALAETSLGVVFTEMSASFSNDYPLLNAGSGYIFVVDGNSARRLF